MDKSPLVITTASDEVCDYLIDFLISIRTLGQYNGELIVLDYGLSQSCLSLCKDFGAEVYPGTTQGHIGSARFIDMIPLLESRNTPSVVAQFDVDIWFQDSINDLFITAEKAQGCLFSLEYVDPFNIPFSKRDYGKPVNKKKLHHYESILSTIIYDYSGEINIGFMAGKQDLFLEKLLQAKALYAHDFSIDEFCSDQYIFNMLFDSTKDSLEGQLYNCILPEIRKDDGMFTFVGKETGIDEIIRNNGNKAIGIHCSGIIQREHQTEFRFHTNFRHILRSELADLIGRKVHHLNQLSAKLGNVVGTNPEGEERAAVKGLSMDEEKRKFLDLYTYLDQLSSYITRR